MTSEDTVYSLWGVREDGSETYVVWWGDVAAVRRLLGPCARVLDWPEFWSAYKAGVGVLRRGLDEDRSSTQWRT